MRSFSFSTTSLLTAFAVLTAATPAAYAADTPNVCVSSYEQSQSLRRSGKLRDAKQRAFECARDVCPAILSRDCQRWATELEASVPTVIFDVRGGAGEELTQVAVSLDGKKLVDRLDGKALEVDPGTHTFRFAPGGDTKDLKETSKEVTIVIREGEKYRKISATFESKSGVTAASTKSRPVPTGVWIFGGIGLAGIAAGTFFGISGLSKKSDLDKCKPQCDPSDVDSMTRNYAIADIALGAGVISSIAALYLYFTRPTVESPPAGQSALGNFSVTPTQGGARASWGMTF